MELRSKKTVRRAADDDLNDFLWLASLIRRLRPDLRKLFKTTDAVSLEFAKWLLFSGNREYRILADNGKLNNIFCRKLKIFGISILETLIYLERADVQKEFPLPAKKAEFRQWFYRYGVDEHRLFEILDEESKRIYRAVHPENEEPFFQPQTPDSPRCPFGVNLIGYAYGQLGIGEDLRMTARALRQVGVPFTIINFEPGADIPRNDLSMAEFVSGEPKYQFNIFCMTALETGRFYAEKGQDIFRNRYNIGYWPWEFAKWPAEWKDLTSLVDEVWVSSQHIYNALAPVSDVPVLIMPLAVELGEVSDFSRKDFNLPENAYLFCFSFDFNSSIHRKNPQACLAAFQKAFPRGENQDKAVGLIIKSHKQAKKVQLWERLKEIAANDSRIRIIEETLSRPDLLSLYKNCNCYLSLHRAEGFGRGIAEAMLLGLDVIATGYSGNVDFCQNRQNAKLVRCKLIPVKEDQYPFAAGQLWAQADITHAAQLMIDSVYGGAKRRENADYSFSLFSAAQKYKKRLKFIDSKLK